MDTTGHLGYEAIQLRQKSAFRQAKENRPLASMAWDMTDALRPDAFFSEGPASTVEAMMAADQPAISQTSSFLIGSVAVGLIIVEGPTDELKFSEDEKAKVVAEVQHGLSWLGMQEPRAKVTWSYDIQVVTIDQSPGASSLTGSAKEALWRDPAMAQLGWGPGMANVGSYGQDLRSRLQTR